MTGTQAAVGRDMLTTTETAADQHVTVESENDPGLEWTNRQMTVKQQQLLMRKRILNFLFQYKVTCAEAQYFIQNFISARHLESRSIILQFLIHTAARSTRPSSRSVLGGAHQVPLHCIVPETTPIHANFSSPTLS